MLDDKKFLSDTQQWPRTAEGIPYCCLKRKKKERDPYENAFLIESTNTVYLGPIFDGGTGEVLHYESIEELLQAGWLVD